MKRLSNLIVICSILAFLLLPQSCGEHSGWKNKIPFPVESIFRDLDMITISKKAKIIDSIFYKLNQKNGFNGCVLYGEKGRIVYEKAFGYDDALAKNRLTTTSSFQLASVSKMFTAMSIMILQEQGKLKFDDSLKKYIPEVAFYHLTIRKLLNHRSGLQDYMSFGDAYWNPDSVLTNEDVISILAKNQLKPWFKPDNGFDYCNTNYALLASVVEHITKKPFDEFVKEEIFQPLGMDHSFIYKLTGDSVKPEYIPVGVTGHRIRKGRPIREPNFYQNGVIGDKGVYSCVEDLFKWDQALYNEKLVSNNTLREAFMPGSPSKKQRRDNYGFGWRIKGERDSTVYHFGWWKGFRSAFIRDLEQEKTIIVLTNINRQISSGTLYDIIDDHRYELGSICPFPREKEKEKGRKKRGR